jgi:catalase
VSPQVALFSPDPYKSEYKGVTRIEEYMVRHFRACDADYGQRVAEGLRLHVGESAAQHAVVS